MVNDQEPIVALEEMEKMAEAKSRNTQVVVEHQPVPGPTRQEEDHSSRGWGGRLSPG